MTCCAAIGAGGLAEGTGLPPLVHDIARQIEQHDLIAQPQARTLVLDLTERSALLRARVLHQLAELRIVGYQLVSGGDVARRDDLTQVVETWGIQYTVEFDSACIEASIYGQSLLEASRARLEESASKVERSALAAARILLSAALMGHFDLADRFETRLSELIREDGDFASVTGALNALLYLYRYDDVLGSARQAAAASLLRAAYQRGLWLVESLSSTQTRQETPEGIRLLRVRRLSIVRLWGWTAKSSWKCSRAWPRKRFRRLCAVHRWVFSGALRRWMLPASRCL